MTVTGYSGTFTAGDWLMDTGPAGATNGAKARFLGYSGTGGTGTITVCAVIAGQIGGTTNNPATNDIWINISNPGGSGTFTQSGAISYTGTNSTGGGQGQSAAAPWRTITYACQQLSDTTGASTYADSALFLCQGETYMDMMGLYCGGLASYNAPSVSLLAQSGNLTDGGVYKYVYTYVTATGETIPGPSTTLSPNPSSGHEQAQVSLVASSCASVTGINIYRTVAGGSTYLLVNPTPEANTTHNYTDNVADGSLGAAAPIIHTAGHPFTVSSYAGSYGSAQPQIWGTVPKYGIDWVQDGTYTNCYKCYISGYKLSSTLGTASNAQVLHSDDSDGSTLTRETSATLCNSNTNSYYYDGTNHLLYINVGGNPITNGVTYYPAVYPFGAIFNYYGQDVIQSTYPQPQNILYTGIDHWYAPFGMVTGDYSPQYNCSFCVVNNVNNWYNGANGTDDSFHNAGQYNYFYNCTTNHCKGGHFVFIGQVFSGVQASPLTAHGLFQNCTVGANTSVPGTGSKGFWWSIYSATSPYGSADDCKVINCAIVGNVYYGFISDNYGSGPYYCSSNALIRNLIITGVCSHGSPMYSNTNITIEGVYSNTSPTVASNANINVYAYTGNATIRKCFLVQDHSTSNYCAIKISTLASGCIAYIYGNIAICNNGTSGQAAIYVTNSSGSTTYICSNSASAFTYLAQYTGDYPITVKNNITYKCTHFMGSISPWANLTSDFNHGYDASLYWSNSHNLGTYSGGSWGTGWCKDSGQDYHSYQSTTTGSGDPLFVNGSGNLNVPSDFMLQWASACIYNNWVNSTGYPSALPAGVTGIDQDYFGTGMPNGGGCQEVGAYQINRGGAF
jgi:hypothetical protein